MSIKLNQPFVAFASPLTGAVFNRSDLRSHGLSRTETVHAPKVVIIKTGPECYTRLKPLRVLHLPCVGCVASEYTKVPKTWLCRCGRLADSPACFNCQMARS